MFLPNIEFEFTQAIDCSAALANEMRLQYGVSTEDASRLHDHFKVSRNLVEMCNKTGVSNISLGLSSCVVGILGFMGLRF